MEPTLATEETEGEVVEKEGSEETQETTEAPTTLATGEVEETEQQESEGEAKESEQVAEVPEKYELKLPENFEANQEAMEKFENIAKDSKLTQDQAQSFVDVFVEEVNRLQESYQSAFNDITKEWVKTAKEDKEFGGLNFNSNMSIVRDAINNYGNDELKLALNQTGIGNHPEFLRFAYKVGKALQDDKFHTGSNPDSTNEQSILNALYPSMKK